MKTYAGLKLVRAVAMTRQQYISLRGWKLPENENPEDEGYLVEYLGAAQILVNGFKGYISWLPKAVFEQGFRSSDELNFSDAVMAMMSGLRVAREGWTDKSAWVMLIKSESYTVGAKLEADHMLNHWMGKSSGGVFGPWTIAHEDALANDWYVVDSSLGLTPNKA